MERDQFKGQHEVEAFDRNMEAMRIGDVKDTLGFPIEEASGTPSTLTPEQHGNLHAWDVFLEDVIPRMEEDHRKAHEIKPFEFRQFNPDHE